MPEPDAESSRSSRQNPHKGGPSASRTPVATNGYAKKALFLKNLRIRAATVTTAQGQTSAVVADVERYQRLPIRPGSTDFVRLRIDSVYGSRKYQDCLLSEIEFDTR